MFTTPRQLVAGALVAGVLSVSSMISPAGASGVSYRADAFNSHHVVSLSSLRGHPVLLLSWASWCLDCRHELPAVQSYYATHHLGPLQLVAVDVDDLGGATSLSVVKKFHLSMTLWSDPSNNFSVAFSTPGVPASVLISATGHVLDTWFGSLNLASASVQRAIKKAE